jgi:hypothetical protein
MKSAPPITADVARVLLEWSGMAADTPRHQLLAAVFQAFRDRAERLYAVDVERFEFDFLHPPATSPRR